MFARVLIIMCACFFGFSCTSTGTRGANADKPKILCFFDRRNPELDYEYLLIGDKVYACQRVYPLASHSRIPASQPLPVYFCLYPIPSALQMRMSNALAVEGKATTTLDSNEFSQRRHRRGWPILRPVLSDQRLGHG